MERNVEINATKRKSEVRKTCLKKRLENIFGEFCKDNSSFVFQLTINQLVTKKNRLENRSTGNTRGTNVVQKKTHS